MEKMNLFHISPHGNGLLGIILYNLQYSSEEILEPFLKTFSRRIHFLSTD